MLSKPLYESLPYVYLIAGSGLLLGIEDVAATALALALYFFGAWVWLQRSEQRRRNSSEPGRDKVHWSPLFYELQPFLYILTGLLIIDYVTHPVRYVSAPLLLIVGLVVLGVRVQRRSTPAEAVEPIRFKPEPQLMAGARVPMITTSPGGPLCKRCIVLDICQGINLEDASIREIMRLSQTVSHEHAFELFRQAVERCEGRRVQESELRPVLDKLSSHAHLCATWRNRGRHAS